MENQLTQSSGLDAIITEPSTPYTELHNRSWNLFAILLALGHPVPPLELASRCTSFEASPEFVEFVCSIPNSPLLLRNDGYVTISSAVYIGLKRFLSNSCRIWEFLPPPKTKMGDCGCKRVWKDVERTYYRKRRRLWPNVCETADQTASIMPMKIQNAYAQVHIQVDDMDTILSMKELRGMNDLHMKYSILSYNRYTRIPSPSNTTLGEVEAYMQLQSSSHLIASPVMQRKDVNDELCLLIENPNAASFQKDDANKMISLVKAGCKFENNITLSCNEMICYPESEKKTSCEEVVEDSLDSLAEAVKQCEAADDDQVVDFQQEAKTVCESKEQLVDLHHGEGIAEYLPTPMDMTCKDECKSRTNVRCSKNNTAAQLNMTNLTGDLIPLDQKQPLESKNLTVQTPSVRPNKGNDVGVDIRQHNCRKGEKSGFIRQKLKPRSDQKKHTMVKKDKSKEIKEKSAFISVKDHSEPKPTPIFDLFTIEEEEGSGGYGTVYKAQRKNDGTTFAIKYPHANANRHHIHNELKMLERFGGKNFVIKYEGSFKSGNSHCLVLEHVAHDRPEILKKEIDAYELRWYGYCLFRALASLHKQGVVHRDVKPGNFLFSRNTTKGYLIDFNLALDLHQKYGFAEKSKVQSDGTFGLAPRTESLPPTKNRKYPSSKALDTVKHEVGTHFKQLSFPKTLKKKTDQVKDNKDLKIRGVMKSQGADGSGLTSTKDATSTRVSSAERLREPIPSKGRPALLNFVNEAMQGPNHQVATPPANKRKRVAAPPAKLDKKFVYLTPMPLHCTGVAVAGAGLLRNKGEGKQRKEGPCVGTKGFRAPEVLFKSTYQGPKVDIWSAGVTLLYLIIGRTPFVGDPDQNIREIAKLRGSEDLWEVAKLHDRESSFPSELFQIQSLPPTKLREWCKENTRRPDFLEVIPRSLLDLVDQCLTVNPRSRISAEDALRHEFFAPCLEGIKKQRLLRQGLSLDSSSTTITCEGLSIS